MTTTIEILLFDGFDEMDAVGPYEVLENGAEAGADLTVDLVTLEPEEMIVASHGLKVVPDGQLGRPDLLVVPGGGWSGGEEVGVRRVVNENRVPRAVAERHADGVDLASVCTGAMILAEGGVLDGRPATTHHVAHEDLEAVTERIDARVVDDGDVVTAAGVTAGIDMALYLLERDFGLDVAEQVASEMEYERRGTVHVGEGA